MNKRLLIAAFPVLLSAPALAKEKPPVFVEAKWVKDAPTVTLDPAKAYILLRTPGAIPVSFVRIPTAEDQAAYEKLRAAAFEDAREDYAKKLARWETAKAAAAKTPGLKVPDKPVEPTEENFQFTPFAQLANFGMGPFNRFANKGGSVFLHAVTPGTYRLHGQNDPLLGGGLCYCMGSVQFDAAAGTITDLGTLGADPAGMPPPVKNDSSAPRTFAFALTLVPADAETPVDPRLTSLPRTLAGLRAAGKMANYWGIAISRLPAIPGVLAYERDRVVDGAGRSGTP
jgi:hypothetical protein